MAGAAFYSSKVNAQVVPAARPAGPLGIGEAISALGRTGAAIAAQNQQAEERVTEVDSAIAEREKARARDAVSARVAVALAEGEGSYARWVTDHQNDADFESQASARVEADMAAVRGLLGEDEVLTQHYDAPLAQIAESRRTAAHAQTARIHALASKDALVQVQTAASNVITTAPDRTGEQVGLVTAAIMANSAIPEALRPGLARQAAGQLWQDGLAAAIQGGRAEAVGKELRAGNYDAVLLDGAKPALLRMVAAEQQAAARQAELAAEEGKHAAQVEIDSIREILDNDGDVPVSRITAALQRGKELGIDENKLIDAAYFMEDMATDRQLRGLSKPVLEGEVERLRGLRAAGKLKGPDERRLTRAEQRLGVLNAKEADRFGGRLKGTEAERVAAIGEMTPLSAGDAWDIAERNGDVKAFIWSRIGDPVEHKRAVQGAAARSARPADFLPPKDSLGRSGKEEADRAFRETVGAGVMADLGGDYDDYREAALDRMAGMGPGWDARRFGQSVGVVFGANRRADGTRQGGLAEIEGRMTELPVYKSAAEFARDYARHSFAGAVYGDGAPARAADVRANFRLKQIDNPTHGEAKYQLIGPNGRPLMLKQRDGTVVPYPLYFRRTGGR